jgi:hypothetical protein
LLLPNKEFILTHNRTVQYLFSQKNTQKIILTSVAESHHFYAAPGNNFDVAPDPPAPAPTLLYSKEKFLKQTKV